MGVFWCCVVQSKQTQTLIFWPTGKGVSYRINMYFRLKRHTNRKCAKHHAVEAISLICDNSVTTQNFVIFQEKILKVLKCYIFLWVQRRHDCSPAASFANCVMTLNVLKVQLQMFLSITITQKCQILSCDTLVAYARYLETSSLQLLAQFILTLLYLL